MKIYIILIALEVFGALIAIYLIAKRKKEEHVICVIGEDCQAVLDSKYNRLFGIHNDLAGLLFYIVMLSLTALIPLGNDLTVLAFWAMRLMAAMGALMGVILMFIQWRVLKSWCFWCIISNVNLWITAAIIFKYF